MPRARGTPGSRALSSLRKSAQTEVLGPTGLDASRHRGLSKPIAASPPVPMASRARCWRLAPQRPRWTSRFRRPFSPCGLSGRLSTAMGPGLSVRTCDRSLRPAITGPGGARQVAPGRCGLDRRAAGAHLRSPRHSPATAPRPMSEMLQTPLGRGGMARIIVIVGMESRADREKFFWGLGDDVLSIRPAKAGAMQPPVRDGKNTRLGRVTLTFVNTSLYCEAPHGR